MKLLTYRDGGDERLGALLDGERVLDLAAAHSATAGGGTSPHLGGMIDFVAGGSAAMDAARRLVAEAPAAAVRPLAEVSLCAPIPRPRRNVFCVGRNYLAHVAEGDRMAKRETSLPEWPQFFTKPPEAVIAPGETIPAYAQLTTKLDYEVELAVIIGKPGSDIAEADAMQHVFGCTIGNDITARDLQRRHGQWFKGKGLDRSCPLGPWIVTSDELDPSDLELSLTVNGERRQHNRTANMIFRIPTIIAQLSAGLRLLPGDVILTGTPEGVGYAMDPPHALQAGDRIVARIEGIGELANAVA